MKCGVNTHTQSHTDTHTHSLTHIKHAYTHTHRGNFFFFCKFGIWFKRTSGHPGRGREAEARASKRGKQGQEETAVAMHLKVLASRAQMWIGGVFNAAANQSLHHSWLPSVDLRAEGGTARSGPRGQGPVTSSTSISAT